MLFQVNGSILEALYAENENDQVITRVLPPTVKTENIDDTFKYQEVRGKTLPDKWGGKQKL